MNPGIYEILLYEVVYILYFSMGSPMWLKPRKLPATENDNDYLTWKAQTGIVFGLNTETLLYAY